MQLNQLVSRLQVIAMTFALSTYAAWPCNATSDDSTLVTNTETKAVKHRERLRSGEIDIHSHLNIFSLGVLKRSKSVRMIVYFDERGTRTDYVRRYEDGPLKGSEYRESISHAEDVLRTYSEQRRFVPGGSRDGATRITAMRPGDGLHARTRPMPDPRLIGMAASTYSNLVHERLNSLVGNPRRLVSTTAEPVERDGQRCQKVVYRREHGTTTVWIAVDADHNIIRSEGKYGSYSSILNCELEQVSGYGWFPSLVTYQRYKNEELVLEETLKVRVRHFNDSLPAGVFLFRGMSVPLGTTVYDFTGEMPRQWRLGPEGLSPVEQPAALDGDASTAQDSRRSLRRLLLVCNGLACALVAAWLLWRHRLTRKAR